ncbi:MAG: flagellar motor switch protein FliN [Pseudomonadota bacterium]|jgi:flagellar motor switch protein FliN/FliY
MVTSEKESTVESIEGFKKILDIPIELSVEVGKTQLSIRELLQMNPGSIVALDKVVSDPLDIYVNGTLIAKGEIITANNKFAIRLIDIINPAERMGTLA